MKPSGIDERRIEIENARMEIPLVMGLRGGVWSEITAIEARRLDIEAARAEMTSLGGVR